MELIQLGFEINYFLFGVAENLNLNKVLMVLHNKFGKFIVNIKNEDSIKWFDIYI